MKIFALDIGDKWVGSAIADSLGITCRPYKTVEFSQLNNLIKDAINEEYVSTIIVGYPKTISGTESLQTQKTIKIKNDLEKHYPSTSWILWDERLSSKRAANLQSQVKGKSSKDKQTKLNSHSIAAAFILQSYLDSISISKD